MRIADIAELAYIIKQAKENNQPQPIFFLGAGASKTGSIPLAKDIVKHILEKHADAPKIKKLKKEDISYNKLMECLSTYERNALLKNYIDNAKINVTHIYLAQLITKGYADYVLTVNFDNLMLRALALFNEFPPTYDMAILKELTTSAFKEKSVVFLHGQHHGLWLLNTQEEMAKVNKTIPSIFDSIKNNRPWVFIGYSGEDPIFNHLEKIACFDNELFWLAYHDNDPSDKVQKFLTTPNRNASLIKGYDADSFMIKLSNELDLEQPNIVSKPFSSIKDMLENIVDIDDEEHFKMVKERLELSKDQVERAIKQFEEGKIEKNTVIKSTSKIDQIKREIIDIMAEENYDEFKKIETEATTLNHAEINTLLASLYFNWGNNLTDIAETKENPEAQVLFIEAIEKYKKVIEIKPDKHDAFYNWGWVLNELAKTKENPEEALFLEAIEKYKKAIEIKPDKHEAFYNWGWSLIQLAKTKENPEAEKLFLEAIEKYKKAIEIKPDKHEAFYNWGCSLSQLAKTKESTEAEALFLEAIEKYKKAIEIKPDKYEAFNNWGWSLTELAKTKESTEAEALFLEAIEKYKKAIEIKPEYHDAFYNWGWNLNKLGLTKENPEAEKLFLEAIEKYKKAFELKPHENDTVIRWENTIKNLTDQEVKAAAEKEFQECLQKYAKD